MQVQVPWFLPKVAGGEEHSGSEPYAHEDAITSITSTLITTGASHAGLQVPSWLLALFSSFVIYAISKFPVDSVGNRLIQHQCRITKQPVDVEHEVIDLPNRLRLHHGHRITQRTVLGKCSIVKCGCQYTGISIQ